MSFACSYRLSTSTLRSHGVKKYPLPVFVLHMNKRQIRCSSQWVLTIKNPFKRRGIVAAENCNRSISALIIIYDIYRMMHPSHAFSPTPGTNTVLTAHHSVPKIYSLQPESHAYQARQKCSISSSNRYRTRSTRLSSLGAAGSSVNR